MSIARSRNSIPFISGIRYSARIAATRSPRSFIWRSASSASAPDSARTIRYRSPYRRRRSRATARDTPGSSSTVRIAVRIVSACSVITPIVGLDHVTAAAPASGVVDPVLADSERLLPGHARRGQDPRADRGQAVRLRLDLVRGGLQRPAQVLPEAVPAGRGGVRPGAGRHCCSRAARRAVMPRAVWLLTAPRLIFIAAAISASD